MGGDAKSGLTRRGFSGLAAGTIAATSLISPANAMLRSMAAPRIDLALYDARFSAPREFASMLRESGVKTLDTGGDIGALWFAGLKDDLGKAAKRVAGMGRHTDFWIMQTLAAEKGLKAVFYAEHDFRGRSRFTHRLPQGSEALASNLTSGDDWAFYVARHLITPKVMAQTGALELVASRTAPAADHPGLLVSWVFA